MNRFDKPYRIAPSFDFKKNIEMFDLASRLDTHEMLQHSLVNQISFDISDDEFNTLIHIVINVDSRKASQHSKLCVIKFLVNNGANPDKPNKYNQTSLHLVCYYQYDLIVEYLLSIGVNVNFADNMGLTPFHYLLTGNIKTIESTSEIMNFIPPPKKQNIIKNENLINIKKDIYKLLIETQKISGDSQKLPIFETFKNTIKNILDNNNFLDYRIELEETITKMALNSSVSNNLVEIKNTVEIILKAITKKIVKLFDNFPESNDFEIHSKEKNSWAHPTNTQQLALIKNGDIKQLIKDEIMYAGNNIIDLKNNFDPYNENDVVNENELSEIFEIYLNNLQDLLDEISPNTYYLNNNFTDCEKKISDINNSIKHTDAFDNASSIMDFKNSKYVGGPRNIKLIPLLNCIDQVILISKLKTINEKILYMLFSFYDQSKQMHIKIRNITIDKLNNDIKRNNLIDIITDINNLDHTKYNSFEIRNLIFYYIIFAKIAISSPNDFIKLSIYIDNANPDYILIDKWYNKFINGVNIATFIYGMWCDITCLLSESNLVGEIHCNLAILISALANDTPDLEQSIFNSYKPLIIEEICNIALFNDAEKITSMTILLLNEKCSQVYWNNINKKNYSDLVKIPDINIDKEVLLIGKLILSYFTNPKAFSPINTTDEGKLYLSYKKLGKQPIYILIDMILDFYDKMLNKPLKQTIIDFIYLLIDYNHTKILDPSKPYIDIFKKMSTKNLISEKITDIDLSKNVIPSHYGLENIIIDKKRENIDETFLRNHFLIAHIFGLYFEGICKPFDWDLHNPIEFKKQNGRDLINSHFIITAVTLTSLDAHSFTGDELDNNQLPLPFNNVKSIIPLTLTAKYKYYNINGIKIINPSVYSYFLLIINRIQYYQAKISEKISAVNKITSELVTGKISQLNKLIVKLYPEIVSCCKIINSYIESYNNLNNQEFWKRSEFRKKFNKPNNYQYIDLAKNINLINANFYLYYYVFSPNKLLKLNKFNYYQIPILSPNKYLFYNGASAIINDSIYNFVEKEETIDIRLKTNIDNDISNLNTGFVTQFSIGNYSSLYEEYKENNFNTIMSVKNENFIIAKTDKLPPSLFENLDQFYKICLIEIVRTIITEIDTKKTSTTKDIYEKLQTFIKSTGFSINDYDLSSYHIVCKIAQEIIREQFNLFIYNEVHDIFLNNIIKTPKITTGIPPSSITPIITKKEISINLDKTDIEFTKIKDVKEVKNLYNLLVQPVKSDIFILYSNDFTNLTKLKIKSGININTKIIELLLKYQSSPYNINLDGKSPIYNLIKNYNFEPVKKLKEYGVDFRYFEKDQPIKFLLKELNNNIDNIIDSNLSDPSIKNILNNFDNYLYNDVKMLITSNEVYGNNILAYLPLSFNMSTYIVLQYLLESLINIDDKFTYNDLINFLSFIDIDINNLNKNYLEDKLVNFNIPDDFNWFIAREFIIEKVNLRKQLILEKSIIDENCKKLITKSPDLDNKIKKSSKYTQLESNIDKLKKDIESLGKLRSPSIQKLKGSISTPNEYKIVTRYKNISKSGIHNGLIMNGWDNLFKLKYDSKNYNLGLIQLFIKQKNIVGNFNLTNQDSLSKLQKPLKKLSEIAESYFSNPKFTETNKVAHFIRDMIEYLTEITICTGLELVIRRILYTYFSNNIDNDDALKISDKIDFILEENLSGMNESLLVILKNKIAPEIAKNASEIFDNQSDEQGHDVRPIRDILIGFFQNLENSPIKLPPEIMVIFIKDVVSYFDTFTSKTILLWNVNAENILKYFINNYRCIETILSL